MAAPRSERFERAYPDSLKKAEEQAVAQRRAVHGLDPSAPQVGFALSGGGIRSATFCLGLFQALARQRLIRRIDLLSTVSGGGYFGSFLGAAFIRPTASAEQIERELADNHSWTVNWLRENGRFLSPNGAGDNWHTAAVALRNWLALHVVLLTFGFLLLGIGALVRADLCTFSLTRQAWHDVELFFWDNHINAIWCSPWLVLPLIPFFVLMVPTGVLYWLTQSTILMGLIRRALGVFSSRLRGMTEREFTPRAQSVLTHGFVVGLAVAVTTTVFAVIDSIGQTIYWRWAGNGFAFPALWTTLTGTGIALFGFAAKLMIYVERLIGRRRFRVPLNVLALGFALLWLLLIVVALSVLAYGLAWNWDLVWNYREFQPMSGNWKLLVAVLIAFAFSWWFSRSFGFVNLSSLQQTYAARLCRAYLGATNPDRRRHENHDMTELIAGDDLSLREYRPDQHGGPLHLINVTVNETVSGKTQIQRRDRKGMAMAVGPCGLSVGRSAHGLWCDDCRAPSLHPMLRALLDERERELGVIPHRDGSLHALSSTRSAAPDNLVGATTARAIEALPLARWVAISGAAFTTGIGSRTNVGLSLLLGLANVRLGYWWDSGAEPRNPPGRRPNFLEVASRLLSRILPVQTCLTSEFFARFHGPARRHWYLSDGGHFENTGCYELLRRRVPLIICCDNGQDPLYQFADFANLVRMARTDFGAEIQIIPRQSERIKDDPGTVYPLPTLEELVHPDLLDVIGAPEDFTPGAVPPSTDDADAATAPSPVISQRHALLARVHYLDNDQFSWLLLIKPSLMGDEAVDVLEYQRTHPLFPQEPTSDQYFDEAQWESYRKLGEHIGTELFTGPAAPEGGWAPGTWSPSQLVPPLFSSSVSGSQS